MENAKELLVEDIHGLESQISVFRDQKIHSKEELMDRDEDELQFYHKKLKAKLTILNLMNKEK